MRFPHWLSGEFRFPFSSHFRNFAQVRPRLESLEGRCLPANFLVLNTNDMGAGSLRQAIMDANATADVNTVTFNVSGSGVQSIALTSALPPITRPVTIDGTTQPGYGGLPLIELNGAGAGVGANGLVIPAGNSTVRGLVINRFSGSAIQLGNSGGNRIQSNFLGTDATGTQALGNGGMGVMVLSSSPQNTIGGAATTARNVISGNQTGILIASRMNVVQNNYIGTDNRASRPLGNQTDGVLIIGLYNTLGGTAARTGNVISGNLDNGVRITGGGNLLQGNFIGTDTSGNAVLANGGDGVSIDSGANTIGGTTTAARNVLAHNGRSGLHLAFLSASANLVEGNTITANTDGVVIDHGARNNFIGGTVTGAGNLIHGNDLTGISIIGSDSTGNQIQGNQIGAISSLRQPNSVGVFISNGAAGNTVGGTAAGAGNVISGNYRSGVFLSSGAADNLVQGNLLGTGTSGTQRQPNGIGVEIRDASTNTIGGTFASARNLISANNQAGIQIEGSQSSGILIQGNIIGTNRAGTQALDNTIGIRIMDSARHITIGGTASGAGNLISGNRQAGIDLFSAVPQRIVSDVTIQGNFIGTNFGGSSPLGNGIGIRLLVNPSIVIGGADPAARNVISGNGIGITIDQAGTDARIQGNYIGTDVSGTAAVPNGTGIILTDTGLGIEIGGTVAGAGNLISGNGTGITIQGAPDVLGVGDVVGNLIGTDVSGTVSLPNSVGLFLDYAFATIGSNLPEGRNLISGNTDYGIRIHGDRMTTRANDIRGNYIGTDISGTVGLGNGIGIGIADSPYQTIIGNVIAANAGDGIQIVQGRGHNSIGGNFIGIDPSGDPLSNGGNGVTITESSDNTIGGTAAGAGNVIAYNAVDGVLVDDGVSNAIRGNAIFGHPGGLGIELINGGNNDQPAPVLTSAISDGVSLTIQGTLTGLRNTTFEVDLFANTACDPSGFGEGEQFLGTIEVTTDENGQGDFTATLDVTVDAGQYVTATTTNPGNNTSQFSACQLVSGPGVPGAGVREIHGRRLIAPAPPAFHALPVGTAASTTGERTTLLEETPAFAHGRREAVDLLFAEMASVEA